MAGYDRGQDSTRYDGRRMRRAAMVGAAGTTLILTMAGAGPSIGTTSPSVTVDARADRVDGVKPVLPRGTYYPDPYPIHTKRGWGRDLPVFSGMRKRLLKQCDAGKSIKCHSRPKLTVTFSKRLENKVPDVRKCRQKMKAFHPFQSNGKHPRWHMAMAVKFTVACDSNKGQNVAFHARPRRKSDATGNRVPRKWVIDRRLVGHWRHSKQKAGYNPRYYYDNPTGRLFLIYIRGIRNTDPAQFKIVARRMKNFTTKLRGGQPRTMLSPGVKGRAIASERYRRGHSGPRLVETANIRRIRGRYVLVYSTGSYKSDHYKIGLAYSDTFLPKRGHQYRKVVYKDRAGIWGHKNAPEVSYLLQAQKQKAAHFTRQVKGPGVGSIVSAKRNWYLFFAGYRRGEPAHDGLYASSHRTPFSVQLRVRVRPKDRKHPLHSISNRQLRRWIVPKR